MSRSLHLFAMATAFGLLLWRPQIVPAQSIATVVYQQDDSAADIDRELQELRDKTAELKQQIDESMYPDDEFDAGEIPAAVDSEKVVEIRRNLELLKKLINEREAKARELAAQRARQDAALQSPPAALSVAEDASQVPADQRQVSSGNLRMPEKVLDKIVNAFELGNSLFQAGNFEQALKYYEIVPPERLSAFERNWLEFMIANCYQRNRQYDRAEAGYRTVAGFKDAPRLAQSAKESLNYVLSRKRLSGVVEEYVSKADAALQKANALMGDSTNGK